ncbi:MAG: serine/threonine-protein kinase [Candidatus Woesearchaeota archaeon]|jgi:serine/threonine-protein kinase|nr:serine/threonine-protein kinase [Candidatus Woesearchaeota archaeon]MDP7181489.1 serine/threonine-protein kinase [Candidatus Woesearchaeota archaeon]MDP7198531.1 serine/threonine-protein kinase [Candidatus Woesearchaeota archaeon]MDP7466727.1 serine/threonine-protein kinase [Candidatus Woesearchaeota archaeon]MDP7647171.1 serine/threonine-protein kinase [Candidatus Woesearchaeota archaeon]
MRETVKDRYEVIEKIGQGGMGVTFVAYDKFNGVNCAIKRLPETFDNLRPKFLEEVTLSTSFDHSNLVHAYDSGEWNGQPFMVMELWNNSADSSSFKLDEVVRLSQDIAEGCGELHKSGILHRDIKPANVLVDKHLYALSDLGLAIPIDKQTRSFKGDPIHGTPQYMSPEQSHGWILAPTSDIYNLGMTMYHLRFGGPLVQGGSVSEVLNKQRHHDFKLPIMNDQHDSRYVHIIEKCTALRPKDRYQSMEELRKDLISLGKDLAQPKHGCLVSGVHMLWRGVMYLPNKRKNYKLVSMTTTSMPCHG